MSDARPSMPKPSAGRRRRTVSVAADALVRAEPMANGAALPGLFRASRPDVQLLAWLSSRRQEVLARLHREGALLLRGFAVTDTATIEAMTQTLAGEETLTYDYRSTPRREVSGRVYSSTDYPPDQVIPQHSEQAYTRVFPRLLTFACLQPARVAGATPLADNRRVLARIPDEVRRAFEEAGVMYVRHYGDGLDLPWQEVFQTDDCQEVVRYCKAHHMEPTWLDDGARLRTRQLCPAIVAHPVTEEAVWFNQAHLFHVSALAADDRQALTELCGAAGLPRQALFGDGREIPDAYLSAVREAFAQETTRFDWEAGDLLLIDNLLVCHGREAYEGERRVVVCMAGAGDSMTWQRAQP
ncbi:MAG: TauD/TfdA family dioxygenase [Pseudomonadota bacterium]